jgi:hypothetical protein
MSNRMREIRTSGSVRGEGGDILTYSAGGFVDIFAIHVMASCKSVGLQRTSKGLKMLARMFALAIVRVSEPDSRRRVFTSRLSLRT